MQHLNKDKNMIIRKKKIFLLLTLARQENFYVFWNINLKKALNYEKKLHPHYNCFGFDFIYK